MTKLTKETIDYLLQPGVLFQSDGSITTLVPLEGEELENANAAYRVGFQHEDIDAVIEEVNRKRGFASDNEARPNGNTDIHSAPSSLGLNPPLTQIFGTGIVLHDVEIDYHGVIVRIGSVNL